MFRHFRFVFNYPKTIISAIGFITLLFLWQVPDLKLDPSIKGMIPKNDPVVVNMDLLDELFGGSEIVIIGVKSDSILYRSTLEKFEALQDSLEYIEQITSVMSLYNASNIVSTDDGFEVEDFLDVYPDTDEEVARLKEALKANDLVYGNIIAEDFSAMAFICQIVSSFDYDEHLIKEKIELLREEFEGPEEIFISGMPIIRAHITNDMQKDMKTFMPFGIFLMIILLSVSFRSWLGVFLPLLVVIISVIWTFGLMATLNIEMTFISVVIPVMLIAIANDYGIHIIAHYYEFIREKGADKNSVIKKTMKSLGIPIVLAGFTTIIGFLSLFGHVLPKIQELGLLVAFGILVAFIMSMILIPAALIIAKKPHFLSKSNSLDGMNKFLHGWANFFMKFRISFLVAVVVLVFVIGLGIPRIIVDTDPDHYYDEGSEIRVNNAAITEIFGGSTTLSIRINADIKDPEVLRKIERMADHMETHASVSRTISIADQIKKMHSAFNGGDPEYEIIPDDRNLIAQYLFLYSLTGDESDFDQFIDDIDEPENAHLVVRLKQIKTREVKAILDDTKDYISANFYDTPMTVTGVAAFIGELAGMVVKGQMISLTISILVIFIVMAIVFRSVIGGLLSVIPLGTAMIFVFGLMGYLKIELNIATAMLSSIMIGVGIDYTVHFLWHLRQHIRAGQDLETAIFTTMRISGKGIVFNALSVVIGFTVLTFSAFLPVYFFGFLITLSITMCLFGALAILPAVIIHWQPKFLFK